MYTQFHGYLFSQKNHARKPQEPQKNYILVAICKPIWHMDYHVNYVIALSCDSKGLLFDLVWNEADAIKIKLDSLIVSLLRQPFWIWWIFTAPLEGGGGGNKEINCASRHFLSNVPSFDI